MVMRVHLLELDSEKMLTKENEEPISSKSKVSVQAKMRSDFVLKSILYYLVESWFGDVMIAAKNDPGRPPTSQSLHSTVCRLITSKVHLLILYLSDQRSIAQPEGKI
jgi:hypothetical protein